VSLFEEPDAGNLHAAFDEAGAGNGLSSTAPVLDPTREEPGPTGVWLKYCGTAGKPGGKRRKQTSACSIGRKWSTRLTPYVRMIKDSRALYVV